MVDLPRKTIALIVGVSSLGGFGFGVSTGLSHNPDPPVVVKREVKWIEKPTLKPQYLTRKEYVTEYVVLPMPESCTRVIEEASRAGHLLNKILLKQDLIYDVIHDAPLEAIEDPLETEASKEELYNLIRDSKLQLRTLLESRNVQQDRLAVCESDLEEQRERAE